MMMTWCWIIPIVVGFITALLGYLLGRSVRQKEVDLWSDRFKKEELQREELQDTNRIIRGKIEEAKTSKDELASDLVKLKERFSLLQNQWDKNRIEIQNLKDERDKLSNLLAEQKENSSPTESTDDSEADTMSKLIFDATAAKSVFGKTIKPDDLTVVEGIGPKTQDLFHQQGIRTWYALSQCSFEECQEILRAGGPQFTLHNPTTWSRQASLAFQGKWEELKKWQDQLDGGV